MQESDLKIIIKLLEEQNSHLKELVKYNLIKERKENIKFFYQLALQLLPFILIIIVGYWAYSSIIEILEKYSENLELLRQGYQEIYDSLSTVFTDINTTIFNTWESTKEIFN
ncbi:hypothetical protein GF376_03925 [Candidatus Peregrinibacteria bacterium]|nr:hypothetical protein [Candidatus Peregrinibacteria bacterium]